MGRLSIYSGQSTEELIDQYELASTDLSNLHTELSVGLADLHLHYHECFVGSAGKSVAEKNRDADFQTRYEYATILKVRGEINYKTALQNMLVCLISWRFKMTPPVLSQLQYPPDHDEGVIGNGHKR